MSSSPAPVDLSSLSLSSRPTQHDNYDYEPNQNRQQYQFQTSPHIQSQYNPLSGGQSSLKKPTRAGLPTQWLDSPSTGIDGRSISSENSDFSSTGSPPMDHLNASMASQSALSQAQIDDDDVIPTAIVIKNIPFNVKRETLLDIIASLAIPTPYAFNYHLDQQGSFRGLAFANFRQSVDADAVVAALNGFDVQGRKLRVEYKKVLQAGEKERIEREKAIRRMRSMQIEKEHINPQPQYDDFGPVMPPAFAPQRSFSGSPYTPQMHQHHQQQQLGHGMPQYSPPRAAPMPVPQPYHPVHSPPVASPPPSSEKSSSTELDLNDPSTLEIYSRILLFKDDRMRDELAFSRTLSPKQRRVVHLIAQKLGVYHYSMGEGEERYAVVTRIDPQRTQTQQPQRHTISRAPSSYLAATAAQQQQQMTANALRVKKSMPDLKTLHSQAPRLSTRASNGNLREGYATISSPSRRSPGGFGSLLNGAMFNNGGQAIPPVPHLPTLTTNLNIMGGVGGGGGVNESPGGVVRQPRGPGAGGFGSRRDSRVAVSESHARLEARSHEPLEL